MTAFKDIDGKKLKRNIRIVNVLLSLLQMAAGITSLILFFTFDIAGTLAAIYAIFLAMLFFAFEAKFTSLEPKIKKNFGFLYSHRGRSTFMVFMGLMDIGIDTLFSIVTGILFCVVAAFLVITTCIHPDFRQNTKGCKTASVTDPTLEYTTATQEIVKCAKENPDLTMKAGEVVLQNVEVKK